jgi:hypothetical protein
MSDASDETRLQRRDRHAREAVEERADHETNARAIDEKTARLEAQRLAKEGADAERRAEGQPSGGQAKRVSRKRPPKLIANPDEVKSG